MPPVSEAIPSVNSDVNPSNQLPHSLPSEEKLPLSFAQQRLWFFDQLQPKSALYNIPTALRLNGPLDVDALGKSLNTILARHEAIRTNFILDAGDPIQVIKPDAELALPVFDLSRQPITERERKCNELLSTESQRPFDLTSDLLIRAALIRLASEEHILFINMHHIISDEWSLRVFFRELEEFYKSFSEGHSPQPAELPIQFADYALWQRDCLSGKNLEKEIAYWKKQLSGKVSMLDLPTDRARPSVQTYSGATESLLLSKNILSSLHDLCRKEGTTLFITLLAAFKTLLHRYTGQEQITVGSPISGRNNVETEKLIGFFVNTLVLRTDLSDELTFRELLARVREVTLGAFAHQELPFEKLIEELQPERNARQLSVIPVMFALQNSTESFNFAGIQSQFLEIESGTAKFDLTFVVRENQNGSTLLAEYNTDLFDHETIARMLKHYGRLLESIIANPDEKISRLQFLDDAERNQLLVEWNQTGTNYPREKILPELFGARANRSPNTIAVQFGEDRLTYHELDERSNQLAHVLRKRGVGPDVLVCISVERSVEMIIGFLGILKAGGAYVPLDPDYPSERLVFMLNDAQSPILLTEQKFAARFSNTECDLLCLDSDWDLIAREEKSIPESQITAENLAYVIYTSGSTGRPKGVAVPHRAITRLVFNTNYIQLDSSDRIAQLSNSSFDAATFEIWGALLHGGTLIGFNKDLVLSPHDFAREIAQNKITTIFLTTALFNQIASDVPNAFNSVKSVLFGGEAVDPKWVKRVLVAGPPQRLLHVYGPTESTTFASWFEIKDVPENANTIPIGKPLSNTTFFVLDRNLQPVPVGVPGELHIGGDGLARDYFNRPELTGAKFIADPFSKETNARLYKTGDLVRYLSDGNIEFVGRTDHQVKIRGFRIELPEIETTLKQHGAVKEALVLVREHNGDKRLFGYVVAQKDSVSVEDLRRFLKQKLPGYMVPSTLVILNQFPLNPNGKIDRNALPSEDLNLPQPDDSSLKPLEKQLKEIWENVIGRRSISVLDNFFDLGGHSLLAVKLFAQIEKQLGKKLPLSLLFQSPTIEQLARAISENSPVKSDPCLIDIQPNGFRPPIFWLHTLGGGGGGGVLRYQKLSQLLGSDQPSYGLVAPPEPFTRIEAMAAHYIKSMRTVQPIGPYHLGGYCFGGVIAFEMARQLQQAGEEVALLALLDSFPPNKKAARNFPEKMEYLLTELPNRLSRFCTQGPGQIFASLRRKFKKIARKFLFFMQQNSAETLDGLALEDVIDMSHYPEDYKHYAEVHWEALLHYTPQFYPGKTTLLETTNSSANESPAAIWKALTRELEIRRIPATHEEMLEEPSVQIVAAELKSFLQQCDQNEIKKCAA